MSGQLIGQIYKLNLTRGQCTLAVAYAESARWKDGIGWVCWPGLLTVATKARYSERHARRLTRELEEVGLLVPRHTITGGRGHFTVYDVRPDAEALQPDLSTEDEPDMSAGDERGDATKGDIMTPYPAGLSTKGDIMTPYQRKGDIHDTKGDIHDTKGDIHDTKTGAVLNVNRNITVREPYARAHVRTREAEPEPEAEQTPPTGAAPPPIPDPFPSYWDWIKQNAWARGFEHDERQRRYLAARAKYDNARILALNERMA